MNRLSSVKSQSLRKTLILSGTTKTAFQTLMASKVPWAQYSASNWSGTTLTDMTGNGRNAVTSNLTLASGSGNGATATIPYLDGSASSSIDFPTGSSPASYTICFIMRQTVPSVAALLQTTGGNNTALHGFWTGNRGVEYNINWTTSTSGVGVQLNWLNHCTSTYAAYPANILVDGVASGIAINVAKAGSLTINGALQSWSGKSAFQFSQLIIWDQALLPSELATV
jgi:hypothetical protein